MAQSSPERATLTVPVGNESSDAGLSFYRIVLGRHRYHDQEKQVHYEHAKDHLVNARAEARVWLVSSMTRPVTRSSSTTAPLPAAEANSETPM